MIDKVSWPSRNVDRRRGLPIGIQHLIAAIIVVLIALQPFQAAASELDTATQMRLQVSLKTYIENKTDNGHFSFFNIDDGKMESLILKNLHPVIFKKDDYYLMCADFLDTAGEDILIDFIVREHHDGFRVEQEIRGRRSYLTEIFDRVF